MHCSQQQANGDRAKSCKKHINKIQMKSNNASATQPRQISPQLRRQRQEDAQNEISCKLSFIILANILPLPFPMFPIIWMTQMVCGQAENRRHFFC